MTTPSDPASQPARTRPIDEPHRGVYGNPIWLSYSGLEGMLLAIDGKLPAPPVRYLTGMRPTDVGAGHATFTIPATEWLTNPAGIIPGGIMAFLADAPLGAAYSTTLPAWRGVTNSEISMSYVRPTTPAAKTLIGRAQVIHSTRNVALVEVTIIDQAGRVHAHGTTRYISVAVPEMDGLEVPDFNEGPSDPPHPYLRPLADSAYPPEFFDEHSGLELAQQYANGELPSAPVAQLLGTSIDSVEEGRATVSMGTSPWLMSPGPAIYGGAIAALADLGLSFAFWTSLGKGQTYANLDMKVQFLRPAFPNTGDLTSQSELVHRGRRMLVANTQLTNAEGKVVALATGSAMVIEGGVKALLHNQIPALIADT